MPRVSELSIDVAGLSARAELMAWWYSVLEIQRGFCVGCVAYVNGSACFVIKLLLSFLILYNAM